MSDRRVGRIVFPTVLWIAATAQLALAQNRPTLRVDLDSGRGGIPEVLVSVKDLLSDRVQSALESGFVLSVVYRVELKESRGLFDRTAADTTWEYVALYDPVRERYVIQGNLDGRDDLVSRGALGDRLSRVYVVGIEPDRPGGFYYQATVEARTLSDQDVDEAFAWLGGEDGDSTRRKRPDFITRTAHRLLVRIAPLPQFSLETKSRIFRTR